MTPKPQASPPALDRDAAAPVDQRLPHLAEVVPSALGAMGAGEFADSLGFGEASAVCVLLIDGLGDELLDEHANLAPTLQGLRAGRLHVGFPSTTAAGVAAVGTGACSGQHGMVGFSFELGEHGVVNALRWNEHPYGRDLRDELDPEQVQPAATTFERAGASGVTVSVVSPAAYSDSGLTRAVLRGGPYRSVHAMGDLTAKMLEELQVSRGERGFCYGYHADLDLVGHLHGPGSLAWRMQLRQVETMVASLVEELPAGALLAIVADHGMVALDGPVVDADAEPELMQGVRAIGGEVRARYLYVRDGAAEEVLAAWRERLGASAWVLSRDEAIAAGWFGPRVDQHVAGRIGDVVIAARDNGGVVRRSVEPFESALRGHHGSVTAGEQRVPLLLARG